MLDFSYQPGDSLLHKMDPSIKLIGLILISGCVLITNGLVSLIVSLLIILVLFVISKLSPQKVFSPVKRILWFLIMIFFMNALFQNTNSCLYKFWIICVSKDGIIKGLNIVLNTISITVFTSFFIRTTTSIEIMKGMEKILSPLKLIGVPTRDIALIMSIALQFIPVFFTDIERIRKAQISRGADFTGRSVKERIKNVIPLVIPAFISAFRRADELSIAIEARGYQSDLDNNSSPL